MTKTSPQSSSRSRRCLLAGGVAAMLLTLQSCAVVAVSALVGTIAYLEGELESYLPVDIYQSVDAVKLAVQDANLRPAETRGDRTKATMVAYDVNGNKITIKLVPVRSAVTRIKIRVGQFGDEQYSRRILFHVEKRVEQIKARS